MIASNPSFSPCRFLLLVIIGGLLLTCRGEENPAAQAVTEPKGASEQLQAFFTPAEQQAILRFKTAFDDGLQNRGGAKRELPYLYEQHARRLRMDYLAQESFSGVFPFNGQLILEQRPELVEGIPFFTHACGFQAEGEKIVNYYCPALDTAFFNYLDALSPENELIREFAVTYREHKTIVPGTRRKMLLEALEIFNFQNPDHQLFYALFHCWVNEEMQARIRIGKL